MLPQRLVLAIMAFLGVAVFAAMRAAILLSITEMVKPIDIKKMRNNTVICPAVKLLSENYDTTHINSTSNTTTKYSWTQKQQGWIFSAFYGGYLFGHIPAAIFPHKLSAKWMFSLSILIPGLCNVVLPASIKYGMCNANVPVLSAHTN